MNRQLRFSVIIFFCWRLIDIGIAYIGHIFDKYPESFAYKFQLYHYNPYIPRFLINFANYDGANYLHIAHDGYGMFQQAYFPLFPLLIYLFSPFFGPGYFLSGLLIANIGFFLGLYYFLKYLDALGKPQKNIYVIILLLLVFPTSFFFGSVYTEGLFFLFVTVTLYCSQKKYYLGVFIFGILAALTRLMGVFLIIPLLATLLLEQHHIQLTQKSLQLKIVYLIQYTIKYGKFLILSLSPLFGLAMYMVYLYQTVHNPLYFYSSVSGFHTGRTTDHLILLPQVYLRYIRIFLSASHNFIYFVAALEFVIFNLFFVVLLYDLWKLWRIKKTSVNISLIGLNIFSLVNLLLPTLTGTMTSLPRYALFSISFFLRIAEIKNVALKITLLILFAIFHILLLSLFIQGYFIS